MMLKVINLIFLLKLFTSNEVMSSIKCNHQKSKSDCYCDYLNGDNDYLGSSISMDCTRIGLIKFPNYQEIENVELLDLSFNLLKYLNGSGSVEENEALSTLKLSFNEIINISGDYFKNFTNLKYLDLSHNLISYFANSNVFYNLEKLHFLDLSFNSINYLPFYIFYPLVSLEELDLSYNNNLGRNLTNTINLFDSSLGLTKNLIKLRLDNVGIDKVLHYFFHGGEKLSYLSMTDNQFSEIPELPNNLKYLDLSGTNLTYLTVRHLDFPNLEILKLNRLKYLRKIEDFAFCKLDSLEILELNDNANLKTFNELSFGNLEKKMEVTMKLKKLSVAGCGLSRIEPKFKFIFDRLETVDLQGNPFTCDCQIFWLQEFQNIFLHQKMALRCLNPRKYRMRNIMDLSLKNFPQCEEAIVKKHRVVIVILSTLLALVVMLTFSLCILVPSYYKNKYKRIMSPDSPYSENVLEICPNNAENLG